MRKCDVRTPEDAIQYIADCQLATVSSMAMKKRRPKYEFERQVSIAQTCVDWMADMGCAITEHDRAYKARNAGSVAEWAKQYMPNVPGEDSEKQGEQNG